MISTVKFDDYDSWLDFRLVRTSTTIGKAEAKTSTVDVDGMDGVLDLTEYFGEVFYKNRTLSFDFQTIEPMSEFPKLFSRLRNELDRKRMKIRLSEDPGYYWLGRVSVDEWKSNGRIGQITVEADVEPYKYKDVETSKLVHVDGTTIVLFDNLRKPVNPTFETTSAAEVGVRFGTSSYTISSAGKRTLENVRFRQGVNEVTFTSTEPVDVLVSYQEKGL